MSKTVAQIFATNPATTILNNDLFYLVQSPYTPGTDAAITGASLKSLFLLSANNLSDLTSPAAARANLGLTAIASASPPLSGTLGGTGINNGASTITIGGSVTFSGAFAFTGTLTGITSVTFPTSGTLATTAQLPTFPITLAQGGTNANLTASNGGIFYSTATAGAILAGTATARQMLQSGATGAPAWSTSTWPATTTANAVLFSSATNTVGEIASAASAVLITSVGSVPSFSQTLPSAVQTNITALGAQSQALNMNSHQINNLTAGVAATDAANVGQVTAASSPLTTKGDLYTFTTVNARLPVGTVDGQILQVSSAAATGLAWSTATFPSTATNAARILRADGTNWVQTTSTFADTYAASSVLYANGANNVAGLTTANNGLLVTSSTGVPSILAGPGATGRILQSNAAAAPSFSTATFPSTGGTSGNVLISDGTNYIASTSLWPNTVGASGKVVISNGTSNVYSTPTYPNASATTRKIIVSDGTNFVASTETWAVPGAANNALISDGTNWAALPTDPVIQRVSTLVVTSTTGTTVIPWDDSIPQITEGDQYMTQAITPKNTNNILVIDALIVFSNSGSVNLELTAALFQDSTANALAAVNSVNAVSLGPMVLPLRYIMTAGTTSATTFRIRAGAQNAGTTTLNGSAGARKLGGAMTSYMMITEYAA
jgi:hypothetical protein